MSGRIFLLMGKSASGKDRMYRALLADPELGLKRIVLYTTRPIRTGEADGEQYHFTDEAGYRRLREQGLIIEERVYPSVMGPWYYFTADDGQIDLDAADYLMIGTPKAAVSLAVYFGRDAVLPLYISVEDGILLQRALNRERSEKHPRYDEMCRRYLADLEDFSGEVLKAAGVTEVYDNNGEPEACFQALKAAIVRRQSAGRD